MPSPRRPPRSLPRGRNALGADAAAALHRERLQAAVIALLCRDGYGATTVDAIAGEANVSTASLYRLYRGKEDLTLATWEAIVERACTTLRAAAEPSPEGRRAGLDGLLGALAQAVTASPDAARVAIVEILAVGAEGPARRRRLVDGLRELLRTATAADDGLALSDVGLAVLAGGTLQVLDQHLRSGRMRPLRAAAVDLAEWGARYATPDPPTLPAPALGADTYGGGTRPRLARTLSLPRGRHGLPAGFVRRHQRGRIVEAVVALAAERGSESISVRDICTHAQISHETFYLHFPGRDEALHAAYDDAFVEVFARSWYAAAEHAAWPDEIAAAMSAWTQYVAAEPDLAHFGLNQARSGGAAAAQQTDEAYVAFARLLARGRPADGVDELPVLVPYALASGIAALVGAWVADGRAHEVPALAPHLTYAVLVPFLGEPAARSATLVRAEATADEADPHADLRGRLMLAFAEAVAEDGYAATRLADVAQRSGIELDAASGIFEDELDCTTQAIDAWARPLILAAASAFLAVPSDPALAAHRSLAAALRYGLEHPALSALALDEAPPVLAIQTELRPRYVSLFLALVNGAETGGARPAPQPQLVLQIALEGIIAVVRQHLRDGTLDDLPAELPQLSRQVLVPFFGAANADRVIALPAREEPAHRPA